MNNEKASAPPDYNESQLNPNYNQPQPPYNMGLNNPQPNQPQMGMNNSQFNQPQAPYPTGTNQFNQPQAPYQMGMNQYNQPQNPYPMGMNNPQFSQSQPNINNPQMPYINNTVINNTVASQPQAPNIINVNVNQTNNEKIVLAELPPSHMNFAIFSCLCCFWPVGLYAVLKAYEVDSAFAKGDYNKAVRASLAARKFARISIGLGIISIIVFSIIVSTSRR